MKEMLKKHWFVIVIAVVLISFVIVMIADTMKVDVKKLNVDGKDVIFSYNEKNYFADDFYKDLIEDEDAGMIIPIIENEIYQHSVEITKEMKESAQEQADNVISQFKASFGEDYLVFLDDALIKSGYYDKTGEEGILEFLTIQEAKKQTQINYIKEDTSFFEDYKKEHKPRMISHILIKMEDAENPTKDEQKKLKEVQELLAKPDADFKKIAKEHSEDPGSAEQDGSLGIVDVNSISQYVENFKNHVYTVGVGQTTEWFATEHGMHIIKVDADDLKSFEKEGDQIYSMVLDNNPKVANQVTWSEIKKQKVEVVDKDVAKKIEDYYTAKGVK